jgi:hypothetical protein
VSTTLEQVHGIPVLLAPVVGPPLRGEAEALELIGDALGQGAAWVALPAARLPGEFFTLSTGLAGALAQKFVNYRLRLAVVGDIAGYLSASTALRAFVAESNRGRQLWFLDTLDDLADRLAAARR